MYDDGRFADMHLFRLAAKYALRGLTGHNPSYKDFAKESLQNAITGMVNTMRGGDGLGWFEKVFGADNPQARARYAGETADAYGYGYAGTQVAPWSPSMDPVNAPGQSWVHSGGNPLPIFYIGNDIIGNLDDPEPAIVIEVRTDVSGATVTNLGSRLHYTPAETYTDPDTNEQAEIPAQWSYDRHALADSMAAIRSLSYDNTNRRQVRALEAECGVVASSGCTGMGCTIM